MKWENYNKILPFYFFVLNNNDIFANEFLKCKNYMLTKQQYYQPSQIPVGASSWQAAFAQSLYEHSRETAKGTYPWDLSVYFGFCYYQKEHDAIFGQWFETEKEAQDVINSLPECRKDGLIFMISKVKMVFDKPVARRVRDLAKHKNGYAIFFKYDKVKNRSESCYQKLTCNHDHFVAFGDETEFENITSYVKDDVPITGRPAYDYALAHFKTDLVFDRSKEKAEDRIDYKALKKENTERKKLLTGIKNLGQKFDMPAYYTGYKTIEGVYNSSNDRSGEHDHWNEHDGKFYGRITKKAYVEFAKKYPDIARTICWEHLCMNDKDSDIIILKIIGGYQVWRVGAVPFLPENHYHCFYDGKKVYVSDSKDYFDKWTVEHELGMDMVDAMALACANDPLVEVDMEIHDDPEWIKAKINQRYYGRQHFYDGKFIDNK